MTNENTIFSFELNESLHFRQGEELSELIGIEVEPHITIQPNGEYVVIRGFIELDGTYRKLNEVHEEEVDEPVFEAHRFMEYVDENEEGEAAFAHRFPVEISVAAERVIDLDNIRVEINSFDYEIPAANQLKLTSTIDIHGIETYASDRIDVDESEVASHSTDVGETFAFDIQRDLEEEVNTEPFSSFAEIEEDRDVPIEEPSLEQVFNDERLQEHDTEEIIEEPRAEDQVTDLEEDDVLEEDKYIRQDDDSEEVEEIVLEQRNEDVQIQDYEHTQRITKEEKDETEKEQIQFTDAREAEQIEVVSQVHQEENDNKGRAEAEIHALEEEQVEINDLSSMFSNKTEDTYTSLRLYIVQEKDTLDTIADRYEIPVSKILQYNRLETENIGEGQLIYIPFVGAN